MEKRRVTRGRPKRTEDAVVTAVATAAVSSNTNNSSEQIKRRNSTVLASPSRRASPGRRVSPARSRTSPVRRSSRPRSTVFGSSAAVAIVPPSPIKEENGLEPEHQSAQSGKARSYLPSTLTTNTSSRAPGKTNLTSSVHSSYSSTTQKTVEIRSSTTAVDSEVAKLTDYLRRSVSKTFSNAKREASHTPATTELSRASSRSSVSHSIYNDDNYSKAAQFSEDEDSDVPEQDHYKSFNTMTAAAANFPLSICRKIEVPREYGGWIGATILMLFIPITVFYLQWCCITSSSCALILPDLGGGQIWNWHYMASIFVPEAVVGYLAFNWSIFLLSTMMFGRHVRLPKDRQSQRYHFNALPIAVLLTLFSAAAVIRYGGTGGGGFSLADFVLKHYLRFCIYGFLNAFVVAIWTFGRSKYINDDVGVQPNIYGRSGTLLVDFALGRQINPKWFGRIEYKQVFYRISLLTTLLYAACFIQKCVHVPTMLRTVETTAAIAADQSLWQSVQSLTHFYYRNVQYESAALLSAILLLIYVLDAIVFEHHLASSFEMQGEGCGALLLLRYAATPYIYSAVAKYFLERRIGNIGQRYVTYLALTLFCIGLFVKRISSAIKYKYRIDPNNALFTDMETIHTFQGRRLLLGRFWGCVRQPNYAGDIMALCGLALPLYLRFAWPPLVAISLCIVLLLHRCVRVNERNAARYHSSWVRYCAKVRNYVVPKVF